MVSSMNSSSVDENGRTFFEEWNNVHRYVWDEFEEKWPYFSQKEFLKDAGLNTSVSKYRSIDKVEKDLLIFLIKNDFEKYRSVDVSKLFVKEKLGREINWLSELGHFIKIYWDLNCDDATFMIYSEAEFSTNPSVYLDVFKKRYGVEYRELELISYFSEGVEFRLSSIMSHHIYEDFLKFKKKWQNFINEEVRKAKKILEKIIDDMFDQNGLLKKETYLPKK